MNTAIFTNPSLVTPQLAEAYLRGFGIAMPYQMTVPIVERGGGPGDGIKIRSEILTASNKTEFVKEALGFIQAGLSGKASPADSKIWSVARHGKGGGELAYGWHVKEDRRLKVVSIERASSMGEISVRYHVASQAAALGIGLVLDRASQSCLVQDYAVYFSAKALEEGLLEYWRLPRNSDPKAVITEIKKMLAVGRTRRVQVDFEGGQGLEITIPLGNAKSRGLNDAEFDVWNLAAGLIRPQWGQMRF